MSKVQAGNLNIGDIFTHNNKLLRVVSVDFVKPGKGGAFAVTICKDIVNVTKFDLKFRTEEDLEKAYIDKLKCQMLYKENDSFVFMNNETFDQIYIKENRIPTEQIPYLIESINLEIEFCGEEPVGIILPTTVILEVIEAEPVIKGQTASSSNKPAILSNGVKVMVPTHVEVGSKIIVRTADSTYSSKYKE